MMRPSLQLQGSCSLTLFVQWPLPYCSSHWLTVSSDMYSPHTHKNAAWSYMGFPHRSFLNGIVYAQEHGHSLSSFCVWYFWCYLRNCGCLAALMGSNIPVKPLQRSEVLIYDWKWAHEHTCALQTGTRGVESTFAGSYKKSIVTELRFADCIELVIPW